MLDEQHEQASCEIKKKKDYYSIEKLKMHNFNRKSKDSILKERSIELKSIKEANEAIWNTQTETAATMETTPRILKVTQEEI